MTIIIEQEIQDSDIPKEAKEEIKNGDNMIINEVKIDLNEKTNQQLPEKKK